MVIAVPEGETGYVTVTPFGGLTYTYTSSSHFSNGTPGSLPPHGIYDTDYALHAVGDMIIGLDPDQVYNMVDDPDHNDPKDGKIFKFHVERDGFTSVHFDAYGDGGVFAPFSHDASVAPEPATLALLGIGLFGFGAFRRKKKF